LNGIAPQDEFLKDIFLTGGSSLFQNFDERLRDGLRASLPADSPLVIRRAKDGVLDAWKGAAKWAGGSSWKTAAVTREEYLEKGAEYLKVCPFSPGVCNTILMILQEHDLGNAYS
jgi:actin-related protein 5